ncbi:Uncharacterised protein [Mycobacteroides abscessus subsp. abscessus]|nr:Uncharacterised protein [Mycobacteroides abscessus subsp. abscessus]
MEVIRWRRYGKDRLYVKRADGVEVGWWDLQENVGHPTMPDCAALSTS